LRFSLKIAQRPGIGLFFRNFPSLLRVGRRLCRRFADYQPGGYIGDWYSALALRSVSGAADAMRIGNAGFANSSSQTVHYLW